MKKNIIILVALIVLFAMPVLAKPMAMVTNPLVDYAFMLQELNDEELIRIRGNGALLNPNPEDDVLYAACIDEYGYPIFLTCEQVEIKYGKDGKPIYIIITDPIITRG